MSIAYPDWSPSNHTPVEPPPRRPTGMAAHLGARLQAEPRHSWKAMAVSIAGHALLVAAIVYFSFAAPARKEMQTITVSISAAQVSQPVAPPVPKLERPPEVVMNLPQIDTAAPPSPNAIRAAPPPVAPDSAKKSDDSATTPPRFDAGYLNNPAPVYPNMSRRLREVGVVQLRVRVSAAGEPLEVQMFKSSGYGRLDDAARTAVQKWKFVAAKRDGAMVEAWVIVPVEFGLTHAG